MDEGAPVTILFTDVEGSTDLRTRRGDAAAHEILRAHEEIVRGCIADSGGREVKALGDGFMIAFTSARKALACSIAIQQAVDRHQRTVPGGSVLVRIGVNTGEVVREGDDLYGQAVNAAARVAGRAKGGEILVAEVTKQLIGSSPDFVFSDRGRLRLKGFPERWRLFDLAWERAADSSGAVGIAPAERTPFVGREAERAELRRLLEAAMGGAGALVMVGGEPGVGKTRLAEEVMADAAQRELDVFAGHCYEMEGAAPYVAVVEIMEAALSRAPSPEAWRRFLGDEAADIAKLVPKLRQACPDIPPPIEAPPEQERRLLFNSIRDIVERSARNRPLILLFDDLQWADDPTLLCIEHLAERVGEMPVLMVATYRDTDVDMGRPLAKTFADLRRRRLARWITLPRLPAGEVAHMLRLLSGQDAPAEIVDAVYSETEGNPFFVEEVYRYLAEGDRLFDADGRFRRDLAIGELDVSAGVRLVIGHRLERLDAGTPAVLTAAAVVGRVFSVELLETMGDVHPDALLDAVEDAQRARLIAPAPDASGEDRFIFAHELIRQTLLAETSLTRRRRLHARVADALERHYAASADQQAATIAHHLLEAGSSGDTGRAFHHLIAAGRFAMGSAAFEEAVRHYGRAAAIENVGEPTERAALLFELGMAHRSAGRWGTAIDAWRQSVEAYEALGDAVGVGRVCAAASYNLAWVARFEEGVEMSRRGLAALGDRVNADRVGLLGMAAYPLAYTGDHQAAHAMADEALALAKQLGDGTLLGHALFAKAMVCHAFMEQHQVIDSGRQAIELFRAAGDLWSLASVSGFVVQATRPVGRFDDVRALNEEFGQLAERSGNYGAMGQHRRARGLVDFFSSGDLQVLQALARSDLESFESTGMPWIAGSWSWLGLVEFLRGNWDEALPLFEKAVKLEPPGSLCGWNAAMLFEALAYRGEKSAALALLESRSLPGCGEPKQWGAASLLMAVVEGLTVLGERARAAQLYPSVVDVFERSGVICPSYDDSRLYERAAGIAALAGGNWDASEKHFQTALRQAAELPHRLEQAHTRRWYGQMLLERAAPGDRDQAENFLQAAIDDYERMGIPRHRDLAAAFLAGRQQ